MLYQFMSGDWPISLTILLILGYWSFYHRSTVHELWQDERPVWTWIGRLAIVLAVLVPIWVAAFDNWRDLLAYSMSAHDRWKSNPFGTNPAAEAVRWVSFGLIGLSILADAFLYARRRNGLVLPLLMLVCGFVYFYFMNAIRMRVDVLLLQAEDSLRHPDLFGLSFTVFWALGLYVFLVSTIFAIYLALFAVAAIVISVIYSLISHDEPVQPESLTILRRLPSTPGQREGE